jgi:hypothetical protein
MSEQAPEVLKAPEHLEALPAPTPEKTLPTAAQAEQLRPGEADPLQQLEAARADVAVEHTTTAEKDDPLQRLQESEKAAEPAQQTFVNADLKKVTLQREIQSIRRKLPVAQRALSKVIHQPVVRVVSEVTSKTATRPSGLLGGGFVAFLGSAIYLYMTKHVGFTYNYTIFLLLFLGGFVLGLALEIVIWTATAHHRSQKS